MSELWKSVLGWAPGNSLADVKRKYFQLAKLKHPNKNPGNVQKATENFKAIGNAWEKAQEHYNPRSTKRKRSPSPPPRANNNSRPGPSSRPRYASESSNNESSPPPRAEITLVFRFKRGRGWVERPAAVRFIPRQNREYPGYVPGYVPGAEVQRMAKSLFAEQLGGQTAECLIRGGKVNALKGYWVKPREAVTVRLPGSTARPKPQPKPRAAPQPNASSSNNNGASSAPQYKTVVFKTQHGVVKSAEVRTTKTRFPGLYFTGSDLYSAARRLFGADNVVGELQVWFYSQHETRPGLHSYMKDNNVVVRMDVDKHDYVKVFVRSDGPSAGPSLDDNANFNRPTKVQLRSKSGRGVALGQLDQELRELDKARELALRKMEKIKKLQRNLGNY